MAHSSNDNQPKKPVPAKAQPAAKQSNALMTNFFNQIASSTTRVAAMALVGAVTSAIFDQDLDNSEPAQDDLGNDPE